jgi:hypothetical protein
LNTPKSSLDFTIDIYGQKTRKGAKLTGTVVKSSEEEEEEIWLWEFLSTDTEYQHVLEERIFGEKPQGES